MKARLEKLVPDLGRVLARFPACAAIAILLCAYLNFQIATRSGQPDRNLVMAGLAAFLAAGATHLFVEVRKWSVLPALVLAALAGLAAGSLAYLPVLTQSSLLFLFPALVLTVMMAPFLRRDARQGAVWLFNLRLGLAMLLSAIVAGLFAGGLSVIAESLRFLFDVPLPERLHSHAWSTALSLIGPLYGLSLVPVSLDEEVEIEAAASTLLERGVSVVINYVLVPIIVIYALILHAYAAKVAILWELPRGQIGLMATLFALGGTGAWLIAWPWRERGTRLLRLFMHGWFWLTIVPAVLLAIAVGRRIADYGVTPERYGLVLVAAWLAALTAYLAYRRNNADMRAILGSLAILLFAGSFGPWGANGLTISSQFDRLRPLLESHGVLQDGRLSNLPATFPEQERAAGDTMIHALRQANGLDRLRPWFPDSANSPLQTGPDDWKVAQNISRNLGFAAVARPLNHLRFVATLAASHALPPSAELIGPLQLQSTALTTASVEYGAIVSDGTLSLRAGSRTWPTPVADFIRQIKAAIVDKDQPQPPVVIRISPEISVLVDSIAASLGEEPRLDSARVWLILQQSTAQAPTTP
jgi:hypothetical protein